MLKIISSVTNRQWFAFIAVTALAAVGIALSTQHLLGMHPCVWCVFQRLVCFVIAFVALIGVIFTKRGAQVLSGLLVVLTASIGVAAAIAQHRAIMEQDSCAISIAEKVVSGLGLDVMLPAVFAPEATCVEAAAKLLGIPYEFCTLLLFSGLGVIALYTLFSGYLNNRWFDAAQFAKS
ncbi:MAG: hypothetical protein RI964_146 [Pseudomonadota bacterium]|jgi:disulfide bond formation protein DsbB